MSARASTILGRFPAHLELAAPGKRVGRVVTALADDLDNQTRQLGEVRAAHRLPDAPTTGDLVRLAGLHGFGAGALDLVLRRLLAIAPVAAVLADATAGDAAVDAAAEALAGLVAVDPDDFAEPGDGGDVRPAWRRVGQALAPLGTVAGQLPPLRTTVRTSIAAHLTGNGTPAGVLRAAAGYLGLDVVDVEHTEDRWWHVATCRDGLAPAAPGGQGPGDLLALEENPPHPEDVGPTPRRHGERFDLVRGGMEAVPATVVVRGSEDRTVAPMVVNRDTGSGVAFEGTVPAGGELRFLSDGRVVLDGAAVGRLAYSFRGAVFADESDLPERSFLFAADDGPGPPPRPVDGVLADRTAYWATTEPVADAFASDGGFPHADGLIEPVWLARGRSRWTAFVGAGTYALVWSSNGVVRSSAPRHTAGFFDRTVFEPDPAGPPALDVGFEWSEREPYAVRLWLPGRFQSLDSDAEGNSDGEDLRPVREQLRAALDRHRAAGVHLRVAYADPQWVLGVGLVRDLAATDPRGLVLTGTVPWPAGTPQPPPT